MTLYLVATPIGNPDDLSLRAAKIIGSAPIFICEEAKEGRRLLKSLSLTKTIYLLNEHTEQEESHFLLDLLKQGQDAALVTDCGTPAFADPGAYLVKLCHQANIKVTAVPGASSLMAALSVAGIRLDSFFYRGFLPRDKQERLTEMIALNQMSHPVVLYDTPYRLPAIMADLQRLKPPPGEVSLAMSLTQPEERILKGSLQKVIQALGQPVPKKEFVLIFCPSGMAKLKKKKAKKPKLRYRKA